MFSAVILWKSFFFFHLKNFNHLTTSLLPFNFFLLILPSPELSSTAAADSRALPTVQKPRPKYTHPRSHLGALMCDPTATPPRKTLHFAVKGLLNYGIFAKLFVSMYVYLEREIKLIYLVLCWDKRGWKMKGLEKRCLSCRDLQIIPGNKLLPTIFTVLSALRREPENRSCVFQILQWASVNECGFFW